MTLRIFFRLLAATPAIVALACEPRPSAGDFPPEEIGRYIAAYMPGVIDAGESVRIRFAIPVDTTQGADALSFQPSAKGTIVWEDAFTLAFSPADGWRPGTRYDMILRLDKLIKEVDAKLRRIPFTFEVRPVRLVVLTEPLVPEFEGDEPRYVLRGQVNSSWPLDSARAEQVLQVKITGEAGDPEWFHDPSGRTHDFVIAGIRPECTVKLAWRGKSIGAAEDGERTIRAPKANELSMLSFEPGAAGERKVTVYFSQKLDPRQDLAGLVLVNGMMDGFTVRRQDHVLHIYPPEQITGTISVQVDRRLTSTLGHTLAGPVDLHISLDDSKPGLRLVGSGVITPGQQQVVFPFEAINLRGIQLEVVRIFEDNMLQYLQSGDLEDQWDLEPVGRIILQKHIDLVQLSGRDNRLAWTRYGLDLAPLVNLAPGSLYQVRIGFAPGDTYLDCYEDREIGKMRTPFGETASIWAYKYDYPGFEWTHSENPCYPAFYSPNHFISRNLLASDIGLLAKQNDQGGVWIYATHISSATPAAGVEIEAFDFQQQSLAKGVTNSDGTISLTLPRKAFFLVAAHQQQRGYLKLADGLSLSLSEFDAGGTADQDGLRGYLYAERDVWRPGDSVHLNFILWDPEGKVDVRHPVRLTVTNSLGQVQVRQTSPLSVGGIYDLGFDTDVSDPTGAWMARVSVGDATFSRSLKIETIKPNRLSIDLPLPEAITAGAREVLPLSSTWLFGTPASGLRAKVDAQFAARPFAPKGFASFSFDDPARRTPPAVLTLFDGQLDTQGKARIPVPDIRDYLPAGQLTLALKTRVFEAGGDFSTDQTSTLFHPYSCYAGVDVPKNRWGYAELKTNEDNAVRLAAVTPAGKGAAGHALSIGLYNAQWRWWWDQTADDITQFNSQLHLGAYATDTVTTGRDGTAKYTIRPTMAGTFMIRVCDLESGHCTGQFYYAGSWGDPSSVSDAASQLTLAPEKETYDVGETAILQVPSVKGAMLLFTLEKNGRILQSSWHPAEGDQTKISFTVTAEMMPNVYAFVTHIQPCTHPSNDMPLRMYGVVPVKVNDPRTLLQPVMVMADELRPDAEFSISVTEKNKQPMAYTLAVVDEGLLSLTRFQTPDPRAWFYRQEALAVQTWDMFDQVLGGYGGPLDRLLSIGGDDAVVINDAAEAERFKPVVMHLGPFYLGAGETAAHKLQMPAYVGAVRVMVVASNKTRWGSVEKKVPVKSDLMVQSTLPRVVSPGETISVPVSVFAMSDRVRSAEVTLQPNAMAAMLGPSARILSFGGQGQKMTAFTLKIPPKTGLLKLVVKATAGGLTARQEVELDVRLPNPPKTEVIPATVKPGETWTGTVPQPGLAGTNTASLELGQMPPIDLQRRLAYLVSYPYGCLEQTVSAAFAQLYLPQLAELTAEQQRQVRESVQSGIRQLKSFSLPSGGFTYWPGESARDSWANSYAGHFLLEAARQGYAVDKPMLDAWREAQKKDAQVYRAGQYNRDELSQAYRLYTLAIDGQPMWSMMNRLRTEQHLDPAAVWMLAAAYASGNRRDVAQDLINGVSRDVKPYAEMSATYGSDLRDKAIILQTFGSLGRDDDAMQVARQIAQALSSDAWYGTHSTAYALMALGRFAERFSGAGINARMTVGGRTESVASTKGMILRDLTGASRSVTIVNTGKDPLFVRLTGTGRPLLSSQVSVSRNLGIKVNYLDLQGRTISPDRLPQGHDFVVQIVVTNPGTFAGSLDELALSYLFPAGWELANQRMDAFTNRFKNSYGRYLDIRDDRIYAFFGMDRGTWTYNLLMTASYAGTYWLPDVSVEAMYANSVSARLPGRWVEVTPAPDKTKDIQ